LAGIGGSSSQFLGSRSPHTVAPPHASHQGRGARSVDDQRPCGQVAQAAVDLVWRY